MFRLGVVFYALARAEDVDFSSTTTAAPTDHYMEAYRALQGNGTNTTAAPTVAATEEPTTAAPETTTPAPTAAPTPAPTADKICDSWIVEQQQKYPPLALPAEWGAELAAREPELELTTCLAAWKAKNEARLLAFPIPCRETIEATGTSLVFTRYYEDGNDKCVEITAVSGAPNLADYKLVLWSNGNNLADGDNPSSTDSSLTGILDPGQAVVICKMAFDDVTPDIISSSINFNGNDQLQIVKKSDESVVDVVGISGTKVTVGSQSAATDDYCLARKAGTGPCTDAATWCPEMWTVVHPDSEDRRCDFPLKQCAGDRRLEASETSEKEPAMTTAAPTVESWGPDERARYEFLAAYRVLQNATVNDTVETTTLAPTSAPTPTPTPAPTPCPEEEVNTYNMVIKASSPVKAAFLTPECTLQLIAGIAVYLNYPYSASSAVSSAEVGEATEFFSLDPEYADGVPPSNDGYIFSGAIKVNKAHTDVMNAAMNDTRDDRGCAYDLGVKIEDALSDTCPEIGYVTLLPLKGSATEAPTPNPTPVPTTAAPSPAPTAIPTYGSVAELEAAVTETKAANNDALLAANKQEIPVKVEMGMSQAGFDACKANPQATAISFVDGMAKTSGLPKDSIIIPPDGIDPPIGTFISAYGDLSGDRRLGEARMLNDVTLSVQYNVAASPGDVAALSTALGNIDGSALSNSISAELVANVGADAVVVAEVKEVLPAIVPTAAPTDPATNAPTTAAATTAAAETTAAPAEEEKEESGGSNNMIFIGGFFVFVIVVVIGVGVASQQQGGAGEAAKEAGGEAPAATTSPAATPASPAAAPASPAAAPAVAPAATPSSPAPLDPSVEPSLQVTSGDLQPSSDDHVQSAAVQIDDSTRATQCCVVCG